MRRLELHRLFTYWVYWLFVLVIMRDVNEAEHLSCFRRCSQNPHVLQRDAGWSLWPEITFAFTPAAYKWPHRQNLYVPCPLDSCWRACRTRPDWPCASRWLPGSGLLWGRGPECPAAGRSTKTPWPRETFLWTACKQPAGSPAGLSGRALSGLLQTVRGFWVE